MKKYKEENDNVIEFIHELCLIEQSVKIEKQELYNSYKKLVQGSGSLANQNGGRKMRGQKSK
ncbi:MAG: hypothetical protein K6U11_02590 [bacterium]|nr:hypothetical protein [bacterium]